MTNLFAHLGNREIAERIETLQQASAVRIERIVSWGHRTPDHEWYDQDRHEWVSVLQGAARLRIEGRAELVEMNAGDCLNIPAHQRHRVEWTSPDQPTIWLAVFYE